MDDTKAYQNKRSQGIEKNSIGNDDYIGGISLWKK